MSAGLPLLLHYPTPFHLTPAKKWRYTDGLQRGYGTQGESGRGTCGHEPGKDRVGFPSPPTIAKAPRVSFIFRGCNAVHCLVERSSQGWTREKAGRKRGLDYGRKEESLPPLSVLPGSHNTYTTHKAQHRQHNTQPFLPFLPRRPVLPLHYRNRSRLFLFIPPPLVTLPLSFSLLFSSPHTPYYFQLFCVHYINNPILPLPPLILIPSFLGHL